MIVVAEGGQGSGKTMFIVASTFYAGYGMYDPMLKRQNLTEYRTHSNFALHWLDHCDKPNGDIAPLDVPLIALEKREWAHYSTFCFTEFHRYADSRFTMTLSKQMKIDRHFMDYWVDLSRKQHFNLFIDTQNRFKIDNRIRDSANYLVGCINRATDKEHDPPQLHYVVIRDPFSPFPEKWEFKPGPGWWSFFGSLYDTFETPSTETELDKSVRELETQ